MVRKQSFISNLFGRNTYADFKGIALLVSLIGTGILIVLYILSYYFHAGIINYLIKLTNGTSLLFIGYILAVIILLDIEVDVEEPEKNYLGEEKKEPKPFKYKLTIVWGVILLALGIVAIYYSNRYRNHYAFECDTFLVDEKAGIYHLDYIECSVAEEAESLEEMKGYQIDKTFRFCEECQEWLDDMESEAGLEHARP